MERNYVSLQFDGMITRLAGFEFGREIFASQIENQVDFSEIVTIEFPGQIIKIASSFVQGFFEKIIDEVGFDEIDKRVKVVTGSEELTKSIFDNLT